MWLLTVIIIEMSAMRIKSLLPKSIATFQWHFYRRTGYVFDQGQQTLVFPKARKFRKNEEKIAGLLWIL